MDPKFLTALAGLISAFGAVAIYRFNSARTAKTRAEILKELRVALDSNDRFVTCELFRMLYRLSLPFSEIRSLSTEEHVSNIIRILQVNLGGVKYQNGRLQYDGPLKYSIVRKVAKLISRFGAATMAIVTVGLIIGMASAQGPASLTVLVIAVPIFAVLAIQLWDIKQDGLIELLVNSHAKKI